MMSSNKAFGLVLIGMAILERLYPGWNGLVAAASQVSPGESRIISAIFITGGMLILSRE